MVGLCGNQWSAVWKSIVDDMVPVVGLYVNQWSAGMVLSGRWFGNQWSACMVINGR